MVALSDYGPFDAGTGANRTEDFWRDFFKQVAGGSGVIAGAGSEFAVSERGAGANLSVDVAAGEAFVRGHWGEATATNNVAISTAHATNPRIDRAVLRADFTANTVSIEILEGTPAGSPTAPALTRSSSRYEISLAQISVPAADTTISNAQITDERPVLLADGMLRYPSTTARDLDLTAPKEGQLCWVVGTYDLLYEYNGSAWAVLLARGAGTPEANVTAGVGALYQRTDGGAGTTLYVKESGAAATGWVAVSASGGSTLVRKTADESVASSTTLQNDDHLTASVSANTNYKVRLVLSYLAAVGGDLKLGWSGPASATATWGVIGAPSNVASGAGYDTNAQFVQGLGIASTVIVGGDDSNRMMVIIEGVLKVAGTAGSFTLQWAQGTSSATNTTVHLDSYLEIQAFS